MAQLDRFQVILKDGQWKINNNGKNTAAFRTQAEAIAKAKAQARKAERAGRTGQVLVQGRNGSWRAEWTYGNDPRSRPG